MLAGIGKNIFGRVASYRCGVNRVKVTYTVKCICSTQYWVSSGGLSRHYPTSLDPCILSQPKGHVNPTASLPKSHVACLSMSNARGTLIQKCLVKSIEQGNRCQSCILDG